MSRPVLRLIAQAALSLLAVTIIVFALVRLTGDPLVVILPETASPEDYAYWRAELKLDEPLYVQYLSQMAGVLQGDFGISLRARGSSVGQLIADRLPATLELGLVSVLLTFVVGIPLGIYAAYRQGRQFDRFSRLFSALGQAAPTFWVGLILIMIFAVGLRALPAGGYGSDFAHIILPAVTIALPTAAGMVRLTRTSFLEVLDLDYVKFARIKGVSERSILWKHTLRNASLPVLTYGGVIAASIITGSVVVETVFAWPGLGQLMIQSIQSRDFPTIQAIVLVYSAIYIGINLAVDILYTVLNPRLRYG